MLNIYVSSAVFGPLSAPGLADAITDKSTDADGSSANQCISLIDGYPSQISSFFSEARPQCLSVATLNKFWSILPHG